VQSGRMIRTVGSYLGSNRCYVRCKIDRFVACRCGGSASLWCVLLVEDSIKNYSHGLTLLYGEYFVFKCFFRVSKLISAIKNCGSRSIFIIPATDPG
jgi:hypothetical protein